MGHILALQRACGNPPAIVCSSLRPRTAPSLCFSFSSKIFSLLTSDVGEKLDPCNHDPLPIFKGKFPAAFLCSTHLSAYKGRWDMGSSWGRAEASPGPVPATGTSVTQGPGATLCCRNLWVLNLGHGRDRSVIPASTPAAGMPEFNRGAPCTCLAFGRTKESPMCGSWGGPGTVTKNFAMGKKKK